MEQSLFIHHKPNSLKVLCASSIEDAKQKAEYDRVLADANQKKEEVHQRIALLRRDYKHLIEQNACLPESLRLSPKVYIYNVPSFL